MTKWEYRIVSVGDRVFYPMGDIFFFNELGTQGWEFCGLNKDHGYVFKRPVVKPDYLKAPNE